MNNILFVSPHPDDETLGCGGSIINFFKNGYKIHWLIVTKMGSNYSDHQKITRNKEIKLIKNKYKFSSVENFDFDSGSLNSSNYQDLLKNFRNYFDSRKINIVFIPYIKDIHTDHYYSAKGAITCLKWFRYKHIHKIFYYECISETNIFDSEKFEPNTYFDITNSIKLKIAILKIYKSELKKFPFPRSQETILSLARIRGSECGYKFAEAFKLIYDRSNFML